MDGRMLNKHKRGVAFKYKITKRHIDYVPRGEPISPNVTEGFTGQIQGLKASDLEERFARALDKRKNVISYEFRKPFVAGRNMPGEIEVDFSVYDGSYYPIQIDGEFAHKSAAQRTSDEMKNIVLDGLLKGSAHPVQRIRFDRLQTQEAADHVVREIFG